MRKIEQKNPFALRSHEQRALKFTLATPLTAAEKSVLRGVLEKITPKLRTGDGNHVDWWAAKIAMEQNTIGAMREHYRILSIVAGTDQFDPSTDYRIEIGKRIRGLKAQMRAGGDLCTLLETAVAFGALICEARLYDELARETILGRDVRRGGKKGATAAHGGTPKNQREADYRASFQQFLAKGLSKGKAEAAAARKHSRSTRTIRKAVTGN